MEENGMDRMMVYCRGMTYL